MDGHLVAVAREHFNLRHLASIESDFGERIHAALTSLSA